MTAPTMPVEVILKRFESPDEVREFTRGRFELVNIGGMTIGRAKRYIYSEWFPRSGFKQSSTISDFELHDERSTLQPMREESIR